MTNCVIRLMILKIRNKNNYNYNVLIRILPMDEKELKDIIKSIEDKRNYAKQNIVSAIKDNFTYDLYKGQKMAYSEVLTILNDAKSHTNG